VTMLRKAALTIMTLGSLAWAQTAQITAIRAGRLFDPKSGGHLTDQVVLISRDRIMDVGPSDGCRSHPAPGPSTSAGRQSCRVD